VSMKHAIKMYAGVAVGLHERSGKWSGWLASCSNRLYQLLRGSNSQRKESWEEFTAGLNVAIGGGGGTFLHPYRARQLIHPNLTIKFTASDYHDDDYDYDCNDDNANEDSSNSRKFLFILSANLKAHRPVAK
jgi:hypothetical protein